MYPNLEAEMARNGITKFSLSKKLNMRYATLVDKLNGKYRIYFDEALRIRDAVCPGEDLEYLFKRKEDSNEKSERSKEPKILSEVN